MCVCECVRARGVEVHTFCCGVSAIATAIVRHFLLDETVAIGVA